MAHIFISYSKKDTLKLAFALTDALNALPGVTAWVDRSMRAGPSWEAQIQAEILKCDVFCVLYSPDINRHLNGEEESYVLNEISYAKSKKKPIIPVMAQQTDPPISLIRAHYIDFTLPGLNVSDLVDDLCAEIGIQPAPPLSPVTPPSPLVQAPPVLRHPSSVDLLSTPTLPFAWIDIPGVIGKKWTGVPYKIAKYPVTNAQYAKFIEAGGYRERKWWTAEGWLYKQGGEWKEPRFWNAPKWNGADYPVVGVSWFEALAFCLWLSEATGEHIMLPTDDQWQYAAQGDARLTYPWGNKWDCNCCNTSSNPCESNETTPVRQYEGKGDSPFGVVDMAGNAWEWCLTEHKSMIGNIFNKSYYRRFRGGSWKSDAVFLQTLNYSWDKATYTINALGFRLFRS